MIIGRAHLVLEKVVDDNGVLQFNSDGSALASNKKVFVALEGVSEAIREKLTVLPGGDLSQERISVTPETAREILKNVPKDRTYSGLLEHVDVAVGADDAVVVECTDGKRSRKLKFKQRGRYSDQGAVLRHLYRVLDEGEFTLCLNRKRLLLMLEAMDKAAEDTSGEAPVWIGISKRGDVALRGFDYKMGRAVLGYIHAYDPEEAVQPEKSPWEQRFSEKRGILKGRTLPKRRKPNV